MLSERPIYMRSSWNAQILGQTKSRWYDVPNFKQSQLGLDYVEVRQFFTNTSLSEADSVAQLSCANRNKSAKYVSFERGGPNLIDVERLGSFEYGRGGRYHIYTYQCVTPY